MKMKAVITLMLLGLLLGVGACSTPQVATNTNVPEKYVPPTPTNYLVVVFAGDFSKQPNIVKQVEVNSGDTFMVALDSNLTTGFQWTEQANISDTSVLQQLAHQYAAARQDNGGKPVAGLPGVEEWTFTAGKTGITKVYLSYSRPWEGGEKGVRTFELTVVVK